MRFGPVKISDALGAILAHSVKVDGATIRKGRVLERDDINALQAAGLTEITAAMLDREDLSENEAASQLAHVLCGANLRAAEAFTGRANLIAEKSGVLRVDAKKVVAVNAVSEDVTLATLPDFAKVQAGQMIATIKIIPYGVAKDVLGRAIGDARGEALVVHPFEPKSATLILTETPGMKRQLLNKAETVLRDRLARVDIALDCVKIVPHQTSALVRELREVETDLILILGASATSDRRDVCPSAVIDAGGEISRFGMPVDPGNLLFLGQLGARQVVGLPGCARSPALNGADWVLERLAAGLEVTSDDIAGMGVGGLLKEIPTRPQPRRRPKPQNPKPVIEIVLLAAGRSSRMRGADKTLELIGETPILRHVVEACTGSNALKTRVVLPPDRPERNAALKGADVEIVTAYDAAKGMASSLKAGIDVVGPDADGVLVVLADMPEITADQINTLIAAFEPGSILRAVGHDGVPGHPVLFAQPFFEALTELSGDEGARQVILKEKEQVKTVPLDVPTANLDLDTPEAWSAWRASKKA